jgi:hypothetical protein
MGRERSGGERQVRLEPVHSPCLMVPGTTRVTSSPLEALSRDVKLQSTPVAVEMGERWRLERGMKPPPCTVTLVPPARGPPCGASDDGVGAAYKYSSRRPSTSSKELLIAPVLKCWPPSRERAREAVCRREESS